MEKSESRNEAKETSMKYPRWFAAKLVCAGLLAWVCSPAAVHADIQIISTAGRTVYRLAVASTDATGANWLIVSSTYDNRICEFTPDGKHLWDAAVGGFVFDLAAGDLDGDGHDEIVAGAADGWVYLFTLEGKLRWKQELGAPVYQVAIAKLDGKARAVVASGVTRELVAFSPEGDRLATAKLNGAGRMMRAGDLDGDGADEVAVLPIRGQPQDLCFFKGLQLAKLKDTISSGVRWDPVTRRRITTGENTRKGKSAGSGSGDLKKANGTIADLDGDGASELIFTPGVYTLKSGLRQRFALPGTFKTRSYDYSYNMRLVAAGNLTEQPGAEIVLVEGPALALYDATGKELGKAVAPQGFTAVAYLPGSPRGSVILSSSPGGDDNLYRLTFEPGWEKALESLERTGCSARIAANLEQVSEAVVAWRGTPMAGADGPFDVVVNHHFWNGAGLDKLDGWIAEVRDYERRFPYSRIRFATAFWPGENAPLLRPDGKPWARDHRLAHDLTREQIVAGAKCFETAHCPFWVQVGHGCGPHLEVATVAAMLDAAPKTLMGFISAEDEQLEEVPYYYEHHIKPILELCLKHKKHFIPRNKDVWWAHWPADAKMRKTIFNGRYRSVLLPSVEDSNSRSPDVNLAARVGLWLDGQVDDWASRCSADWFCASRAWEWEYVMSGHPQLRYYVSQALLGARVFMMLNGEREPGTGRWTRVGSAGTATFLHLLGKGVITPPRREQLRAISPIALVMEQPTERFQRHGANGHHEEYWANDGTDNKPWVFDRLDSYWAMAPLPPTDVATYLWGRTRRDASHLPMTAPQGFVCLIPDAALRPQGPWSSFWTTDGDQLNKDGKAHTLLDARGAITAELSNAAKQFPFHVEGQVFHQIIEGAPNRYLIVLMDPGWLDPADRAVTVRAQVAGAWTVTDRLTGQRLGALDKDLNLTVPAGALRVLDVNPAAP